MTKNSLKNQDTKKSKPKKVASKKNKRAVKKAPSFLIRAKRLLKDERSKKIGGSVLLLLSAYLLIAFVSYLLTWQSDQSIVQGRSIWDVVTTSKDIIASNWLGKFGASISHLFIFKWFGLASFLFVLNFFVIGLKIISNIQLLEIKKMVTTSAIAIIWSSVFFGYLSSDGLSFIGGGFGFHVSDWLSSSLGNIGTLFLLLVAIFIIIVILFNPNFGQLFNKFVQNKTALEADAKSKYEVDTPEVSEDIHIINSINEDDIVQDEVSAPISFEEEPAKVEKPISNSIETTAPTEANDDFEITAPVEETIISETSTGEVSKDGDFTLEVNKTEEEIITEDKIAHKLEEFGEFDPKLELSAYALPPTELLNQYGSNNIQINKEELENNKNKIVETLGNYSIKISKIKATIGPTVTLYEIVPAPGVRISKIKNLEDDIALSLAALGIRIIAPIPGKGTIGIEVPNSNPDTVSMRSLIASEKFQNSDMELPVALGKTIANETFIYDLAKMPHLLMAGATGQGKSVGLNAILVSILYKKHPSQVKFVLVDPKKVELTLFNKIERHFLAKLPGEEEPIITDTSKVVNTVNSLCVEMDERYELLKQAHCRNIKEYNKKFIGRRLNPENGHRYLPYIVLVVDEFADLIMTAGKEIETPVARLAQLARAIGIHLIIATQRPSVNIITGTIKANFPARIAFRVTSKIDSRTILDSGGADQLIGRGDMLLSTGNDLIRLQCGFVDTPEVEKICDFIGSQKAYPDAHMLPEFVGEDSDGPSDIDLDDRDVLFEEAAGIIVLHQQGSASLLQRKLKIGYNRAGRIIDQLEANGIIGPFQGSKAREVLYPDQLSLEQFLNGPKQNTEE